MYYNYFREYDKRIEFFETNKVISQIYLKVLKSLFNSLGSKLVLKSTLLPKKNIYGDYPSPSPTLILTNVQLKLRVTKLAN